MKKFKIKSFCKINLSLRILKKLTNGYHNIKSLITFCDLHDVISISKINSYSLGGEHGLGMLSMDWSFTKSYAEELRDPSVNAEFVVKDINWDYEYSDSNHPQVSNFTDEDGATFDQHDLSKYELDAIEIEGDYIPSAKSPNGNLVSGDDQVMAFNASMPLALGVANGEIKVGAKLSTKEKKSDNRPRRSN